MKGSDQHKHRRGGWKRKKKSKRGVAFNLISKCSCMCHPYTIYALFVCGSFVFFRYFVEDLLFRQIRQWKLIHEGIVLYYSLIFQFIPLVVMVSLASVGLMVFWLKIRPNFLYLQEYSNSGSNYLICIVSWIFFNISYSFWKVSQ